MQRSEEVPLAVAVILPFSVDNTTSAHYACWRIRHRHMGRKAKMKNVNQRCRTLISGGLDHSHWFFCLSVCTACGVEHSGGRCLHCRWLLCGQGGSLRVDDMHLRDISTCGWRSMLYAFQKQTFSEELLRLWGATCYIMDQSAFFLFFWGGVFDWGAFTFMLAYYSM